VPFWVLDGFGELSASSFERMAGTTRLELATSAVTVRFYNNLQDMRGLPNAAQVIQDIAFCGLDCGLRILPFV